MPWLAASLFINFWVSYARPLNAFGDNAFREVSAMMGRSHQPPSLRHATASAVVQTALEPKVHQSGEVAVAFGQALARRGVLDDSDLKALLDEFA
ncbi:MAG: hypothetical protein WAO15_22675, partial [Mycobacterium sp.]